MPNIKRGMMGAAGGTGIVGNDVYVWGGTYDGESGLEVAGDPASTSSPAQLGGSEWTMVGVGNRTLSAIKGDDSLHGAGWNGTGPVGDGTVISRSSPVQIGALTTWSILLLGSNASSNGAIKTDGTLWNWGSGSNGVLGHGNTINRSSPVQVGSETDWTSGSAGGAHMMAIREA